MNSPKNINCVSNSLYDRIGGETVLQKFVDYLYGYMDVTESVSHIRAMHSAELGFARNRLFMFLSGMLGGPPLYTEAFGHPRIRRKHLHYQIGNEERDQWLACAQWAADQLDIKQQLRDELMRDLTTMADHIRNKDQINHMNSTC